MDDLLSQGRVLYFGPIMECEKYLTIECGFAPVATNPADFIIHVARETRDNADACKFTLEHMASVASKRFKAAVLPEDAPDLVMDANDWSRDGAAATWMDFSRTIALIGDNIRADIEDIRKSRITIRVLCEREFLKEIRRYKFWLTAVFRAIVLGLLLGVYTFHMMYFFLEVCRK